LDGKNNTFLYNSVSFFYNFYKRPIFLSNTNNYTSCYADEKYPYNCRQARTRENSFPTTVGKPESGKIPSRQLSASQNPGKFLPGNRQQAEVF
jgi:hypothetical protein